MFIIIVTDIIIHIFEVLKGRFFYKYVFMYSEQLTIQFLQRGVLLLKASDEIMLKGTVLKVVKRLTSHSDSRREPENLTHGI